MVYSREATTTMHQLSSTVTSETQAQKSLHKGVLGINLIYLLFIATIGLLGFVSLEWLGNTSKLLGAIHAVFVFQLEIPVELFFGFLLLFSSLGVFGTILQLQGKKGSFLVILGFLPLAIAGISMMPASGEISGFAGMHNLIFVYASTAFALIMVFLQWRARKA